MTFLRSIRIHWTKALIALVLLCAPHTHAQEAEFSEYGVKAAFLYNLPDFVEWPAAASPQSAEPMTLCVIGKDPFGSTLKYFEGKLVKRRPVHIVNLTSKSPTEGCELIFIAHSERKVTRQILAPLTNSPILTVGEDRKFTRNGGIVALLVVKDQIRLEINLAAARAAGLSISSNLLRMAHVIEYPVKSGGE